VEGKADPTEGDTLYETGNTVTRRAAGSSVTP